MLHDPPTHTILTHSVTAVIMKSDILMRNLLHPFTLSGKRPDRIIAPPTQQDSSLSADGALSAGVQQMRREVDCALYLVPVLRMGGSITSIRPNAIVACMWPILHLLPNTSEPCFHTLLRYLFFCLKVRGSVWSPPPPKKKHVK
jgi:hypothetical protein